MDISDAIRIDQEQQQAAVEASKLDLTKNWLDASTTYSEPRYLVEYRGTGFGMIGSLCCLTGQAKNGKTFVLTQLMSAALGSSRTGLLRKREDSRLPQECSVLYVDTEQELDISLRVLRRVHYLLGWPLLENNPRFRVLRLRDELSNDARKQKFVQALEEVKATCVVLDGLRDIMDDINAQKEAVELISELMRLATDNNCVIMTVLHENPGSDKVRGTIGTELVNKSADVFVCRKEKKKDGQVIFNVSQRDARSKDVDDWRFRVDDSIASFGVPVMLSEDEAQQIDKEELASLAQAISSVCPNPHSKRYTDLKNALKETQKIGSTKAERMISQALSAGILSKPINGRYTYNNKWNESPKSEPKQNETDPLGPQLFDKPPY